MIVKTSPSEFGCDLCKRTVLEDECQGISFRDGRIQVLKRPLVEEVHICSSCFCSLLALAH